MTKISKTIDGARRRLGDVENALVDEWLGGRIDRRLFLQHASRLGIGLPLLSAFTAGMGYSPLGAAAEGAAGVVGSGVAMPQAGGASGGVVRAGVAMPHGAIDPILVNDSG